MYLSLDLFVVLVFFFNQIGALCTGSANDANLLARRNVKSDTIEHLGEREGRGWGVYIKLGTGEIKNNTNRTCFF